MRPTLIAIQNPQGICNFQDQSYLMELESNVTYAGRNGTNTVTSGSRKSKNIME